MRTGNFFSSPGNGLVVGVVVGAFVVLAMTLAGFGSPDDDDQEVTPDLPTAEQVAAARDAFVASWSRMTETTWRLESTYTRTLTNGQTFSSKSVSAQIPPNSVVDDNGSVTAVIDDRNIVCSSDQAGRSGTCEDRGEAAPFADRRSQQLTAVRTAVETVYDVTRRSDECFLLTARPGAISAGAVTNWGNRATFCFDETSGALDSTRIERDGGVDVTVATRIQDNITMGDLRAVLPAAVPSITTTTVAGAS